MYYLNESDQPFSDISYIQDGWTALHIACSCGHTACTEMLLAKGASVDAVDVVKRIATLTNRYRLHNLSDA